MNKRRFLQMLGGLPFMGVAAKAQVFGTIDTALLREWIEPADKIRWFVGPNQRCKYRWVDSPVDTDGGSLIIEYVNADDLVEDMDDGSMIIERIEDE